MTMVGVASLHHGHSTITYKLTIMSILAAALQLVSHFHIHCILGKTKTFVSKIIFAICISQEVL